MIHGNVLVLAMLLVVGAAGAHSGQRQDLRLSDKNLMELDAVVMASKDKPNELQRVFGLKSYLRGDGDDAVAHFTTAARYADKYSQHYLSLMYWHGAGVPEDRAQAYVWADLAAERGNRTLLLIREKMWSLMTSQEQQRALALGEDFYTRFGDEIAKPRVEGLMRAFARDMTGSRLGYRNQMIEIAGKRASLGDLSRRLLAIAGVRDGVVFQLDPCPRTGVARIAALAVVAPGVSEADVQSALREHVDAVFLPRPLRFVDALPRNETGKLPRAALAEMLRGCDGSR